MIHKKSQQTLSIFFFKSFFRERRDKINIFQLFILNCKVKLVLNIYLIYFHFHFYSVFNSKHLLKHINRSKLIISRNQRWWEQSIIQFQMHFAEKKHIKTVNGNTYFLVSNMDD